MSTSETPSPLPKLQPLKKRTAKPSGAPESSAGNKLVLSRHTTIPEEADMEPVRWKGLHLSAIANLIVGHHPARVMLGSVIAEIGKAMPDEALSIHCQDKDAKCVLLAHEGLHTDLLRRIFVIEPTGPFGFLLDALEAPLWEDDLWARAPEESSSLEFLRQVWGFPFGKEKMRGMLLIWGDEDEEMDDATKVSILSFAKLIDLLLDERKLSFVANEIAAQAQGRRISLEKALEEVLEREI